MTIQVIALVLLAALIGYLLRNLVVNLHELGKDFDFGKVEAIATIGKLKGKPEHARAVISIGVIIGGADGSFDADERQAVKDACFAVGIDPGEFDL